MPSIERSIVIRSAINQLAPRPEDENDIGYHLGRAYDAGHTKGSGVRRFTAAESDLLEGIRLLSSYAIDVIDAHVSGELAELMRVLKSEDEKIECHARMSDSFRNLRGISLDGE